ncbi:hypothetical protein A2V68_00865 [candidate division Kazan bacterium RBG_13_50_9]|uniref:Uncharacterized protein n=1 Tax=candidate division Kazan bacterium RBG_13_50_9 TaxID=1798535 RepID=A0A1F4NSN9_UNCK3|nr:MAG: hypothetical protein A2V68_00865 [candidate division Kazan bacterium RBG_13_50_9]
MDGEEPNQNIEQEEILIEKEWDRIERLLAHQNRVANSLAVIEADKLFREVLGIISFGETVNEAIQNASDTFSNIKGLMEARKVYEDIIEVPGFSVDQKVAKQVTAIYLQAILDMMGKDYQEKGFWKKLANEITYFGELHPRLLRNIFVGILVFLVGVWFLADTTPGQWLVNLAVGLTHFILSWVWWLILILLVILGIVAVSWLFFERHRR